VKDSLMLTILAGVSVFVIGQFLLKLILEPIVSFKTTTGELSALFLREQAKITNARASEETQQELKRLASSILAHKQAIPFYGFFAFILCMPTQKSLIDSCRSINLIAHLAVKTATDEAPQHSIAIETHNEMKNISKKMKLIIEYSGL
jgi:hypothetical protein